MTRKKAIKKMTKHLEAMLGQDNFGMFLAIICDLLNELLGGETEREMRTIEIILNDFFSTKFDFVEGKLIK